MKIASEIAGKAYGEYGYSSDATGKTGIDIQVDELESIIGAKLEPVRDVVKEQQSVLAATLQFITKENMIDEYLGAMRAAGIEDGFGVRGKDVLALLSEDE